MTNSCSRRDFFGLSCGGYVAYALAAGTALTRSAFAKDELPHVAKEAWAYARKLADGVWSATSTPFQPGGGVDPTTFSNGGIIAGKDAVLVIEGFNTPKGAHWQSELAKQLTGRYPTHVVLTHYHGDHSGGLAGYQRGADGPSIVATQTTRGSLLAMHKEKPAAEGDAPLIKTRQLHLPNAVISDTTKPTVLDLGGRTVTLTPRMGHTQSDITISIDNPRTIWCGDLYFNQLFPYYGDAVPTNLDAAVTTLIDEAFDIYVPGHGPNATKKSLTQYREMLRHVEQAARKAVKAGTPAAIAWPKYKIPESLGKWAKFRPDVYSFAFVAWERELNGEKAK